MCTRIITLKISTRGLSEVYIQLYFGGLRADSGIQRSTYIASRVNAKVKKFVSWRPDPEACAVDAFSFDWGTQVNYAFPPISLIPRVLSKVQEDQACVLLVAPVWTCQIWYPMLLRLLI